jgi:DNA-binding phage protein
MIDRTEILAQMGRKRLTISEVARRTGLTQNAVRAFLNGGDAKVSSVSSIAGAVGLLLILQPQTKID